VKGANVAGTRVGGARVVVGGTGVVGRAVVVVALT
jgi:hypothetical protein